MGKFQALACLLMLATFTSQASVIAFDGITTLGNGVIPAGYEGFDWVGYDPLSQVVGGNVGVSTGNNATVSGAYAISSLGFQLSRTDNGLFDATDLYAAYGDFVVSDIVISGFTGGSLTHQTTSASFSWTATLVNIGFTGIDLLRIESSSIDVFSVDNLSVSAVPLPAAAWLFGSGLLSFAGIARRKS
jgi:hypothetical protein